MATGPTVVVGGFAAALWLGTGVDAGSIARFSAYLLAFVVLPGFVAYRALTPRPPSLLALTAVGGAVGYALLLAAYVLSGVLGTPAILYAYPAVVVLAGGLALARSSARDSPLVASPPATSAPAFRWLMAGACMLALASYAATFFTDTPLPGNGGVTYAEDVVSQLAIAAEAKHHWPVTDPSVAGESLDYHLFQYLGMAAASRVTGVELPTVMLRLDALPQLGLLVLLLAWAGATLSGRRAVGLVAVAVVLVMGELDFDPIHESVFGVVNGYEFLSGLLLSLVFFVPAAVLLYRRISERSSPQSDAWGEWLLIALLLFGSAGTRGIVVLPLFMGALGLWIVWQLVRQKALSLPATAALALTSGIFAASYWLVYGGSDRGTDLDPFASILAMRPIRMVADVLPVEELPFAVVLEPLAAAVALVGLLPAVLVGCGLVLARGRPAPRHVWLIGLTLPALVPLLLLRRHGGAELTPLYPAAIAAGLMAAEGLILLWERLGERLSWRTLLLLGIGWLGALALVGQIPRSRLGQSGPLDIAPEVLTLGALALGLVALHLFWRHTRRRTGGLRGGVPALALAGLALASALDKPLDAFSGLVFADLRDPRVRAGHPAELTPGLHRGLVWIRENTDPGARLAVNNYRQERGEGQAKYFYYSAFSERRVFLEGWLYSARAFNLGYDGLNRGGVVFPGRFKLNEAAFRRADPRALRSLAAAGVRFLVVDRVNGSASPIEDRAAPAFANHDVRIYRLRSDGRCFGSPCRPRQGKVAS